MSELSNKEKKALSKVKKLAQIEVLNLDKNSVGIRVTIAPDADVLKIAGSVGDWLTDVSQMLELNNYKATGEDLSVYMQNKNKKGKAS